MHDLTNNINRILGIKSNLVTYQNVIDTINSWVQKNYRCQWIIQQNVFTIINALDDPYYRELVESASLCVPDGLPIIWAHNLKGANLSINIRGPELMIRYLQQSVDKGIRHFFYGGAPGVAQKLKEIMESRFPGIKIVGTYSPPFRDLTTDEDRIICNHINTSHADVLWVGLGAPKQDIWMYEHRGKVSVNVMLGIGQAFDIHANITKDAPIFLQRMGLEWFFRLCKEPRRLIKRYLYNNPRFIYYISVEYLGLKYFNKKL